MAKIEKFEDIKAWQKARIMVKKMYDLSKLMRNEYELISQIKRSSGSIMDNIAEGFERGGRKEFIHFLSIAKGSSGELRSQLYRLLDNGFISKDIF
ncbi:four helix bundle protein [Bacteroidota bacterium]